MKYVKKNKNTKIHFALLLFLSLSFSSCDKVVSSGGKVKLINSKSQPSSQTANVEHVDLKSINVFGDLVMAASYGDLDVVKSLVGSGASKEAKNYAFALAATSRRYLDVTNYLLTQDMDPSLKNDEGYTVCDFAFQNPPTKVGSIFMFDKSIPTSLKNCSSPISGAPAGTQTIEKTYATYSDLILAAKFGQLDVVKALVNYGVTQKAKDIALVVVAQDSNNINNTKTEIIKYLMDQGADARAAYVGNETPLGQTACALSPSLAAILNNCTQPPKTGGNPGTFTQSPETSGKAITSFGDVLLAAKYGQLGIVKALVKYGAGTTAKEIALSFATEFGALEVVKYLVSTGVDVKSYASGQLACYYLTQKGGQPLPPNASEILSALHNCQ